MKPQLIRQAPRGRSPGFTLVELVVVITIVAILATVSAARFSNPTTFNAQGMADQLVAGLQVARATAVAQRASVYVTLSTTPPAMNVCLNNPAFAIPCAQPLNGPDGSAQWLTTATDLVLAAQAGLSFDPQGTPSSALTVQVSSSDGTIQAQPVVVEAGSGYVHSP